MRVIIQSDYQKLSKWAADYVAQKINRANSTEDKPFILGLPTGSSPIGMYKELSNINKDNVNILNGNAADLEEECNNYEKRIEAAGGIDLFIGGIGPDGHIAFNEPGSSLTSRTRIKTLTTDTIIANSRFFDNDVNKVPKTALTVGVGTVLSAKEVLIICNGHNKARALQHAVEGGITQMWTISALQLHQHGIIVCDEAATDELKVATYKYFKNIEKDNL